MSFNNRWNMMMDRAGVFVAIRRRSSNAPSPARRETSPARIVCRLRIGLAVFAKLAVLSSIAFAGDDSSLAPKTVADEPSKEGMVYVSGGRFQRGSPEIEDAIPVKEIEVDGFWIDKTEVTNAQFAKFVAETKYVTVAERPLDPKQFPGVDPKMLVPGSIVFTPPRQDVRLDQPLSWWDYVPGADWRHPEGPRSTIDGRDNHPVVQVCYEDAVAYASWAKKRLPTEAEWEYAARGGLEGKRYTWGDEFRPGGRWMANIWQGRFPSRNTKEDGFAATSPVATFPPNGFGLYDMAGNAWEWCADWYRPDAYQSDSIKNPAGPISSFDPDEPNVPKRVQRGGSFLCTDQYCARYTVAARGKGATDSAATHVGFRCVRSGPGPGHKETESSLKSNAETLLQVPGRNCCVPPSRFSLSTTTDASRADPKP